MKSNILIGLMTTVWLVLMASIIWQGTDGKWQVEDAEKIGKLEVAKYTDQIIVVAVSEDDATLCFYEKNTEHENDCEDNEKTGSKRKEGEEIKNSWSLVLKTEAVIGENGLGKTKEGDGKTPIGIYSFTNCFGILKNPKAKMDYVQVDKSYYWVDDSDSNYYNQFVSTDVVAPDWNSAEHILEYGESYHYVLATSYNIERIPGKGSAVFLHCTSEKSEVTQGCIAVPEVYMQEIVKRVEPQSVLIIDAEENILLY